MLTKKQFTILFCVFLFAVVAYQTQPAEALPFDHQYTDVVISAGAYDEYDFALTTGEEISGYFETSLETEGLDFFICDAANFTTWDLGGTADVYELATDMHTLEWSFTALYSDTWYIVHDNTGGATTVTVDIAYDVNGDNAPVYSSYDYVGYREVLEDDEYYYVSITLGAGAVIDGGFSTFFTTDGLDFFICDSANFADWESGYSPTAYSIETDMHIAIIDPYTTPAYDTYYCVFVAYAETDTVTFSYGINVDTSGVVNGSVGAGLSAIGLIAAVLIIGILCCVCRSKKKDTGLTPPTVDHYRAPAQPAPIQTIREREIVRDRVLVICPYCGAKNEQGILRCHSCNAEI